jgi:hypothetical protein
MRALNFLTVLLSSLAAASAVQTQQAEQQPPPRYERLRPVHRAPRDDTFFNTGPLMFKGVDVHAGWIEGSNLDMNVPDAVESRSQGLNPPFVVSLQYDEMDFEAEEVGATIDMNLFRFSVDGMKGRWHGEGRLFVNDAFNPPMSTPVDLHGDFWGAKGAVYWPAFRLRQGSLEVCLGPEFSVSWYYEGLHGLNQSPLPFKAREDEMVGGFGPKLSVRVLTGGIDFSLDGEIPYLFGAIKGWGREATAGIGVRF